MVPGDAEGLILKIEGFPETALYGSFTKLLRFLAQGLAPALPGLLLTLSDS